MELKFVAEAEGMIENCFLATRGCQQVFKREAGPDPDRPQDSQKMYAVGTIFHNWIAIGRRSRTEDATEQAMLTFTRFHERLSGWSELLRFGMSRRFLERAAAMEDLETLLQPLQTSCSDVRVIGLVPRLHYAVDGYVVLKS